MTRIGQDQSFPGWLCSLRTAKQDCFAGGYFQVRSLQFLIQSFNTMPQLYQTQIKQSPIHGLGIFACEDIPKGATYWVFQTQNGAKPCLGGLNQQNIIYTQKSLQEFQRVNKEKMRETLHFGFYIEDANVFIVLRDGTAFMNHSDCPNSQIVYNEERDPRKLYSIALKDIKAGQEITESYSNYLSRKASWVEKWMSIYLPEKLSLQAPLQPEAK